MCHRRRVAGLLAGVALGILSLTPAAWAATVFVDLDAATQVFTPNVLFINVGDTVQWRYTAGGGLAHNVVSDPGVSPSFTSGAPAQGGGAPWPFSVTFNSPATVRYFCQPHGGAGGAGMSGVIYVGNAIAHTIGAWDLQPIDDSTGWDEGGVVGSRILNAGTRELRGNLNLPSGSQIVGLEVVGCDNSVSDITATLRECAGADGGCTSVATAESTGVNGVCGTFPSTNQNLNATVQNAGSTYVLEVSMPSSLLSLRRVKVSYRRQISPAPGAATFGDVGTGHQFFQQIEALVAAGVTSGCAVGPPRLYCPADAVSRGQMAAFLARALGLSWPN